MYDDRRKFWLGSLLLLLLAVGLSAGWWMWNKRSAEPRFGAISLSESSQSYGAAWGYPDAITAHERAQQECARSGARDCSVRVSLTSKTCSALVMTAEQNQTFAVTDTDKTSAGAFALAQCQATGASDCAVQVNFCGAGSGG